ncbi:hypothetical protein DM01DRAFT_1340727 [Hesseltinella vesiculosa]|uniref:Uncharacterized protein n=1 Tax=Hesseltinella vesiculosa TaxID=101127 RepID=A0A1X2G3C3_9FUNG|nr:hypothetical protein DM01DRAFT_1340727 [Hesseltinella vesiculosa]
MASQTTTIRGTRHASKSQRPGTDETSKIVLKHAEVKNIVTNAVLGMKVADADWNGTRPDVLYLPTPAVLNSLPPLLAEIQNTIDSQFLQRGLIDYSLNVVKVHKALPVVLFFAVHKISPRNLLSRGWCGGVYSVACALASV